MSESSFWRRSWFKNGKVWVECDESSQPIERDGKVIFAYKKGDQRTYSTALSRLRPIEGGSAEEGARAVPPSPSKAAGTKARASASTGGSKRGDDQIFGGSRADVENPESIHLWSDGACSGNPGPAGAGTVLLFGDRRKEMSTWLGEGTNNVAELVAVLQGFEAIRRPLRRGLVVHTDSQYVIGVLARGWKVRANEALVASMREQLNSLGPVVWHWVRGHEGVELNERCDALARAAIERRDSIVELLP